MLRRASARFVHLLLVAIVASVVVSASGAPTRAVEVPSGVNAGGGAYLASNGTTYAADGAGEPGSPQFSGGRMISLAETITGTDDTELYTTLRSGGLTFTATDVAPGSYEVVLSFVEPSAQPGSRVFDVIAEGLVVADDLDIAAVAGGALIAHDITTVVDVTDGEMNIELVAVSGRPVIAAISTHAVSADAATVTVAPDEIAFGAVPVFTTAGAAVVVSNPQADPVELTSVATTDGSFTVTTPLPLVVPAGADVAVDIEFTPSTAGVHSATVTLLTDDPVTPELTMSVSGAGDAGAGAPDLQLDSPTLTLELADIGVTTTATVTGVNAGTTDLVIDDTTSTNPVFAVATPLPLVVAAGETIAIDVGVTPETAGETTSEISLASNDPDTPTVVVTAHAVGRPFTAGAIAVIGCSNTHQHIAGYLEVSEHDQLAPVFDMGGGSLSAWFSNARGHWDIYEANRPETGYEAAWVQICLRSNQLDGDHETQLTNVIDEIGLRDGDIPIFVSPLNFYVEGHVCTATGELGPTIAAALADWATTDLGVVRGPDTGPLGPEDLARDGCHLNGAGETVVGAQLAAFFDPM